MSYSNTNNQSKDIAFSCDGLTIVGTLHLPSTASPPVVIGSHGLFSDRQSPKQISLANACNQMGMAFLRIDHRGCGDSEGSFKDVTDLEGRRRDLAAAIEMMKNHCDTGERISLFGSSLGGAVCLYTASDANIVSLVTVAAPVFFDSPVKADHAIKKAREDANVKGPVVSGKKLTFDIRDQLDNIESILIFHGDADDVVPLSNAHDIYDRVKKPKQLVILESGDHRMSDPDHQKKFIEKASEWFKAGFDEISAKMS